MIAGLVSLVTDLVSSVFTLTVCVGAFGLALNAAYTFFSVVTSEGNKQMVLFPVGLFMFMLMWDILMVI